MKIKKKDIITAAVIIIFVALLVGGCIFLASRRESSVSEKVLSIAHPIWQNKIIIHHNGIHAFDRENLDLSELPIDLSAYGIENFNKNALAVSNIDGMYLYFSYSYYEGLTNYSQFYRYNLLTAETSLILSSKSVAFPMLNSSSSSELFLVNSHYNFYAHSGYLYYFGWDGDTRFSDVSQYLCRVPVGGGEEEILAEYENINEYIRFVEGDRVITETGTSINVYDISKNKRTELWNAKNNGYSYVTTDRSFVLNGKYYFLASKEKPSVAESEEGFKDDWKTPDSYLIALDIKSGKFERVLDIPIYSFCISEDKVYYVPTKYSIIPPEDLRNENSRLKLRYSSDTLYSCDLDGKNPEAVYSSSEVMITEMYCINGGNLYTLIAHYPGAETYSDNKIAAIRLSDGQITQFDLPE